MAQDAGAQVGDPAVRIDQGPVVVARDRVDRQVASRKIRFERHVGRRMEDKAAIAPAAFALGPCQCVLVVRLRMQEDWKVAADRPVAGGHHLFGRGAYNDEIVIGDRAAEKLVANRAADAVDLHGLGPGL